MLLFFHFYYQEDESFEVTDLQMVVFDWYYLSGDQEIDTLWPFFICSIKGQRKRYILCMQ